MKQNTREILFTPVLIKQVSYLKQNKLENFIEKKKKKTVMYQYSRTSSNHVQELSVLTCVVVVVVVDGASFGDGR